MTNPITTTFDYIERVRFALNCAATDAFCGGATELSEALFALAERPIYTIEAADAATREAHDLLAEIAH